MIAFWLERLLKRIEVQHQGIGPDHLDRFQALVLAHAVVQLDRAEVGKQQDVRRHAAHLVGGSQILVGQARPLRADPERDPHALRDQRQPAVDVAGGVSPTGHAGDEEGQLERLGQEAGRRIDGVQVELRERLMGEGKALEAGAAGGLDGGLEREPQVLELALGDF